MRPILAYDLFKTIAKMAEDIWIENQLYKKHLIAAGINSSSLEQELQADLKDEETRQRAHDRFAEMWRLLDDTAEWFVAEDLGSKPPPTDKQN